MKKSSRPKSPIHNNQREWYALLTLFFFFLERDLIIDSLFIILQIIFEIFG